MIFDKTSKEILTNEIHIELNNQDIKYPNRQHDIFKWLSIISEEFGEIHKEALEMENLDLYKFKNEIIQTISLLVRLYFTPYHIKTQNELRMFF